MEKPTNTTFKRYLLFWAGQIASTLGSSIVQFVIIWWITLQTQSGIYLSLAALVGLVPMIVLSPFVGVLVDRWNRKCMIAIADFSQALATLALILLFWAGAASIWNVLVLLGIRGSLPSIPHTSHFSCNALDGSNRKIKPNKRLELFLLRRSKPNRTSYGGSIA